MNKPAEAIRYGTAILLVVVGVVYLIYALKVFPIPGSDSSSFLPPALSYAEGRGLTNPIYYLSEITDVSGQQQYNYYVPFYTWFFGLWIKLIPGIKTIFFGCAALTITALALYRKTLVTLSTSTTDRLFSVSAVLSVPYLATYSLPTIGRPEQLTAPLLLALYLLYKQRQRVGLWMYNTAIVLLLAVLLSAQITACYFAFIVLVIADVVEREKVGKTLITNLVRFVVVSLLFCLILALSPNGFKATMEGLAKHSQVLFHRKDRSLGLFAFYWILSPFNIGFILVFLVCAYHWVCYLKQSLLKAANVKKAIILALHVAIAGGIFSFVLRAAPTIYNLAQFIYVIILFILERHSQTAGQKYNRLWLFPLTCTLAVGTLLFVRTFILFADTEMDGHNYDAAKRKLEEVEKKYGRCTTGSTFWALYDDPYKIRPLQKTLMYQPYQGAKPGDIIVMPAGKRQDIPANEILTELSKADGRDFYYTVYPGDLLVMAQAYKDLPKQLTDNCEIIEDWRTADVRKFLGIPISRHPYGYSFVVLRVK